MRKKLLSILLILMFSLLLTINVLAENNKNNSNQSSSYYPTTIVPIIAALALFYDPKVTVRYIVKQCNSNLDYDIKEKRIKRYITDSYIMSGDNKWLLEWKPGKLKRMRIIRLENKEKAVYASFEYGSEYMFLIKKKTSEDRRKSTYVLVKKVEPVESNNQ